MEAGIKRDQVQETSHQSEEKKMIASRVVLMMCLLQALDARPGETGDAGLPLGPFGE